VAGIRSPDFFLFLMNLPLKLFEGIGFNRRWSTAIMKHLVIAARTDVSDRLR